MTENDCVMDEIIENAELSEKLLKACYVLTMLEYVDIIGHHVIDCFIKHHRKSQRDRTFVLLTAHLAFILYPWYYLTNASSLRDPLVRDLLDLYSKGRI